MKIIRELSEYIEDEIEDSCKYGKLALEWKDKRRGLADVFFNLSQQELQHMQILHGEVVKLIEEYRATQGDPPEGMLAVYDYLHEKQIDHANEAKAYQMMYKEN